MAVVVVVVDRAMEDAKTATTPRGIDTIINIQTQSHKLLLTNFYLWHIYIKTKLICNLPEINWEAAAYFLN